MIAALCIALAAGGVAVTISKSKMFLALREWAWLRWRWLGQLLYCPYCTAHWLVFAGVAVYQPRLVQSNVPLFDVVLSALVIVTAATFIAALLVRSYKGMFAELPPPGEGGDPCLRAPVASDVTVREGRETLPPPPRRKKR